MGRHVKRSFISFLVHKFKLEIRNHCDFVNVTVVKDLIIYIKN